MIHTADNFFNKVATEIRDIYFKGVNHFDINNSAYDKATQTIELFNNGCITYRKFVGRLAKACNTTNKSIHACIEKYIVSFGNYEYKISNK